MTNKQENAESSVSGGVVGDSPANTKESESGESSDMVTKVPDIGSVNETTLEESDLFGDDMMTEVPDSNCTKETTTKELTEVSDSNSMKDSTTEESELFGDDMMTDVADGISAEKDENVTVKADDVSITRAEGAVANNDHEVVGDVSAIDIELTKKDERQSTGDFDSKFTLQLSEREEFLLTVETLNMRKVDLR